MRLVRRTEKKTEVKSMRPSVCLSISTFEFFKFNVVLPKPISGVVKSVCNIYAHAILHTCSGLLSYLFFFYFTFTSFFYFCCCRFFPLSFFLCLLIIIFYYYYQPGKYCVCVCVCVCVCGKVQSQRN